MESPWLIIEGAPEAAAALTWKRWLGPAFPAVAAACLCDTKREVKRVPCENGCECNHRVRKAEKYIWDRMTPEQKAALPDVHQWAELLVGRCECDENCEDILLAKADVAVWEFDLRKLRTSVAKALGCSAATTRATGYPRTIQVAALGNPAVPVMLTVQPDHDHYRNAVVDLMGRLPKGFILLTPTKLVDEVTLGLLTRANVGFYDLESHLELTTVGGLRADTTAEALFAAHVPDRKGLRNGTERAAARHALHHAGKTCRVVFDGSPEFLLEKTLGTEYLDYLLHHPNQPISAYDLEMKIRPDKARIRPRGSIQNNLDPDTIRAYLQRLDKLRPKREVAAEEGNHALVKSLDEEIGALETEVNKNVSASDPGERARGNVGKAISAVKQTLSKGVTYEKAFGEHIEQLVSTGYECIYNQPQGNIWQ